MACHDYWWQIALQVIGGWFVLGMLGAWLWIVVMKRLRE